MKLAIGGLVAALTLAAIAPAAQAQPFRHGFHHHWHRHWHHWHHGYRH